MRSIRGSTDAAVRGALVLALAFGVGCNAELPGPRPTGGTDDASPRRGGILTSATFGDLRSLDPAGPLDGLAAQTQEALYAGLLDYDQEGKIVPDLAESFTVSPDATEHTFTIRPGARFHDGEEVTAADVKRSAERALHPTSPSAYASYFASLVGFEAFTTGKAPHLEGVRVDGRYVVTFRIERPDSAFLPLLAMHTLRPVCRSAGERYADAWHACGAGPFKLPPGGWDRGRQLLLVRHEGYFRPGEPYLDGVRLLLGLGLNAQRFKFFAGDQDLLREVLVPDALKLQADRRWSAFGAYDAEKQMGGEAMNTEMAPFDNVELRRAIAAALDREQLQKLRASNLRAAYRPVPPGVDGADPETRGQRHDLAEALEHMRRAGYPYDPATGKGGYPHLIPHQVYNQGLQEFMAQVEQQQLARIGIRTEIRLVNYAAYLSLRARRGAVAFGPGSWQQDYPEAGGFLEPMFHSRSINDTDSNNWSFYKNPRVDDLVDRARHDRDPQRRRQLYREAEEVVCDEAPWAFTYFYRFYTQWQPHVRGFRPHAMWALEHRRTWLDRAAGPVAAQAIFGEHALGSLLGGPRVRPQSSAGTSAGAPR